MLVLATRSNSQQQPRISSAYSNPVAQLISLMQNDITYCTLSWYATREYYCNYYYYGTTVLVLHCSQPVILLLLVYFPPHLHTMPS